jgi:integrase
MKKEFRVPLSLAAMAVIEEQRAFDAVRHVVQHVFPSPNRAGQPLSAGAFNELLARLEIDGTPHGIARSSFRDWAGDCTDFPREVAEAALAHTIPGVEGAYRRLDAFDKRAKLMSEWSNFLVGSGQ